MKTITKVAKGSLCVSDVDPEEPQDCHSVSTLTADKKDQFACPLYPMTSKKRPTCKVIRSDRLR